MWGNVGPHIWTMWAASGQYKEYAVTPLGHITCGEVVNMHVVLLELPSSL